MPATNTTDRIVSAFKLSFDGEGLNDVDCVEVTPPKFEGTAVSLQRCTNGKTEAIGMQGGFTKQLELKVKVCVNADSSSSYILLHKWLKNCTPKSSGGGGLMPKCTGSFVTYSWGDKIVEEYTFKEAWCKKFELDECKADDENDLFYATFTIPVECYEQKKR